MGQEYDVYLNGEGYMLAKGPAGRLVSGALREQRMDPFSHYVAQGERWDRVAFRFRDGAGAVRYDGTERYAWGYNVDSRSGDVLLGPLPTMCDDSEGEVANGFRTTDTTPSTRTLSNQGGHLDGVAVRFQASASGNIRTMGLMVKRNSARDYSGAAAFTVEIQGDTAGPRPDGVAIATTTVSLKTTPLPWRPFENNWLAAEYFWLEVSFGPTAMAAVLSSNYYWLCVINAQIPELYWAYDSNYTATVSNWTGASWSAGSTEGCPLCKVKFYVDIDGIVRSFCNFQGSDSMRRLYAAVGPKVMYYDEASAAWGNSKGDFNDPVHQLLVYNSHLFAADGDTRNMFYSDGASATTTWTDSGVQARALAIHDNLLWKADFNVVEGSSTGLSGSWTHGTVTVGDPGTPILALTSHGGQLYGLKPEGVFEISYPDTYPLSGDPTANLVLDFRTEICGRNWVLDWHGGLYFAGHVGLEEWKSGLLRDAWRERFDDSGDVSLLPLYDDDVGKLVGAAGTTRGIALARFSPFAPDGSGGVWWYDGRSFHPQTKGIYVAEPMEAIHVESLGIGRGRLWWGLGFDIAWAWWPTWTDDRSQDDAATFWDGAGLPAPYTMVQLPLFSGDRLDQLKDFYQVTVYSENAGSANGGDIEVDAWIDGTYYNVGTITTSPLQTLTLPANTTGYEIEIRLTIYPEDSSETPRIKQVDVRFQPLPDTVGQHQVVLALAGKLRRRTGGPETRAVSDMVQDLIALLEESEPWVYTDVWGVDHCVRASGVTPVPVRMNRLPSSTGVTMEAQVIVSMLEVADSCPS